MSGRIIRPRALSLDPGGASALPIEGGASCATLPAADFAGVIGFRAATTHARGARDEDPVRSGARRRPPRSTQAHTGAEMTDLTIRVGTTVIAIGHLCAELTALSHFDATQPSIGAMDGACFEQVRIGRYRLSVAIDRQFFRTHDTHDKLCAACVSAAPRAVLRAPQSQPQSHPQPRSRSRDVGAAAAVDGGGPVLTTIVKSLRWVGKPYPGATLDHHVLTLPGVGRLYFGEMLVSGATRRLTMLRLALDGAVVGDVACCEVEAGGAWHR